MLAAYMESDTGIYRQLLQLMVPLLADDIPQQFCNAADAWIIGRYGAEGLCRRGRHAISDLAYRFSSGGRTF